ncbi:hypothetical protein ACO0K9_13270 [Undibacterium sp. Ji50W]|uniref:hypothetical protein n=1 Tax=Undibacterium sp. Ji50W TaxID=3413041 RepID=UPI003BF127C6
MNSQDDGKIPEHSWPILQSIAAKQAHRPALLTDAEREARWQCLPVSDVTAASASQGHGDSPNRKQPIASQLQHLTPTTTGMSNAQNSSSIQALFQRLAAGEKNLSAPSDETGTLGPLLKK